VDEIASVIATAAAPSVTSAMRMSAKVMQRCDAMFEDANMPAKL